MLGLNKFGFHEFQYKGARNYQPNYSTPTLSPNSSHVAGINQVIKHITKNRPQMLSITKLYLTLRKKLLFVSMLLIAKARSDHMTLGMVSRVLCTICRQETNLKLQFLPYSSWYFYLAFDNKLKANKLMKSGILLS